ncbi:MAG: peptidylprolyl isomerase [Thermaurantimonas sp.]|uniref:peptidylprolyl isomerase n=1 Tax=Thermaurantimonas sp. TaxID=2681568 RepID=UPI00391BD752
MIVHLLTTAYILYAQESKKVVDGVAAVVGSRIILKSEIEANHENLVRQGQMENTLKDMCKVFEDLLLEKLLIHQAEIDSVVVTDEEVDANIERRIQMIIQQIGSVQKLEEFYKKSIIEIKEEMSEMIKDQMTAEKMQRKITEKIEVTPSEILEYFNSIPSDSLPIVNAEVEYSQIVLYPKIRKEAKQEAIDKLKRLKERIERGSSFASMAVLYSEDPGSAKNGGEYRGIKRGQFVKEFEAVAFNLRKGEISDPFETEYGFHIVQLLARRGEELDLRHILIKPKIDDEDLEETSRKLDSIRTLIVEGVINFETAAERFSMDENTRYNRGLVVNPYTLDPAWEIGNIERDVFTVIQNLKPGQISEPVFFRKPDGKEGFRIIRLNKRTEAHKINLQDDYNKIKQLALMDKQNKVLRNWIEKKLQSTYVRLNHNYYNCTFTNSWIKNLAQNE